MPTRDEGSKRVVPPPHRRTEIAWHGCARQDWDCWLTGAGRSSLEQSWSYGEAVAACSRQTVARAVIAREGRPLALVQAFARRLGAVGSLHRILRGPVWLQPDLESGVRLEVLRAIKSDFRLGRRQLLLWLPELPDAPASDAAMRSLGSRRMVTGYSSVWLDLRCNEAALRAGLHVKWRNALRAAEKARLQVKASYGGRLLTESLDRYDGFRRSKRFTGPSGTFIGQIAEAGQRHKETLLLSATGRGEPLAGIVLIRHGASATYYAGWTSPEGRRLKAHNLLLWRGIGALREAGTDWLDLGGVDPSVPGVARFKLGLGGEAFTLAGTYL